MEEPQKNTQPFSDEELFEEDEEEDEEDDDAALKKRISAHSLYGKLLKLHLDCLKIGEVEENDDEKAIDDLQQQQQPVDKKLSRRMLHQSDLDHFMESYCAALSKLREAIEAPQQESMAFITTMHSRLHDITAPSASAANANASHHP